MGGQSLSEKVGHVIEVVYHPEDPEDAVVSELLWSWPVLLWVLSAFFGVSGFLILTQRMVVGPLKKSFLNAG